MDSRAPSIKWSNELTPDMREAVSRTLEERFDKPIYRLITLESLRELSEIRCANAPVVSLYLQLTPERRLKGAWHIAYKDLVKRKLIERVGRPETEGVERALSRVESALRDELPNLGRGVAFFAGGDARLWRQIAVPIPLPDLVTVNSSPYIRPLARTQDEHDRYAIALVSREHSRFFMSQIGFVDEVLIVEGEKLRGMATDIIPNHEHDAIEREMVRGEAKMLAHVAALVCQMFGSRHLMLSGAPRMRSAVAESLPKSIRALVGGDFETDIRARDADVASAAEPLQREIEAREEMETVSRLQEDAPRRATWGVSDTFGALNQRSVMTLVVDDDYRQPGGLCNRCGILVLERGGFCTACGGAVSEVEDVVDAALEQGLRQGAELELVRSERARTIMRERAPMGALLRY